MARGKATTPLQIVRAPTVLKVIIVEHTTIQTLGSRRASRENDFATCRQPHPKLLLFKGLSWPIDASEKWTLDFRRKSLPAACLVSLQLIPIPCA
jgi:hypothetical protein